VEIFIFSSENYRLEDSLKNQHVSPDGKSGTLILCGPHKFIGGDYSSSGSHALLNLLSALLNRTKGMDTWVIAGLARIEIVKDSE
jgi:hypothetical protein